MKALFLLPLLLFSLLLNAQPGNSSKSLTEAQQWYNKAVDLYKANQFSEAFTFFKNASDKGNALASRAIGIMYYNGKGLKEDKGRSFEYYQKAANGGDAVGMYNLATQYFYGEGVAEDQKAALQWYTKAAAAGNANAMDYVSQEEAKMRNAFYRGQIALQAKNYALALQNFRKSAAEGNSNAMYELGRMILLKQGIDSSKEAAKFWFRKSATIGNAKGFIGLDVISKMDEGKYTKEQAESQLTATSGSIYTNGFYTLPANINSVELICSLCKGSGLVPGTTYGRVTRNGKTTYGKYEPCPICNSRKVAQD
jgi:TPR repeat protein